MTLPSPLKTEEETTDLAGKSLAILRLQEAAVDLVGSVDDGRHGVLVARGHNGEERERRQRQVVHAARHAALVVAVRVQAGKGKGGSELTWNQEVSEKRSSSLAEG